MEFIKIFVVAFLFSFAIVNLGVSVYNTIIGRKMERLEEKQAKNYGELEGKVIEKVERRMMLFFYQVIVYQKLIIEKEDGDKKITRLLTVSDKEYDNLQIGDYIYLEDGYLIKK